MSGFLIVIYLSILLTKLVADQRGAIYEDIDGKSVQSLSLFPQMKAPYADCPLSSVC